MPGLTCPHCGTALTPEELDNARFDAQMRVTDGCWLWEGARQPYGYGAFGARAKNYSAHRWQWERHHGPLQPGQVVMHLCDTPECVRPDHLAAGTQAENIRDKMEKGRHRYRAFRGEEHPRARLTWAQVHEIRARHAAGESGLSLHRAFGVSRSTMYAVLRGEHWREG